jgi:hypothetical protein
LAQRRLYKTAPQRAVIRFFLRRVFMNNMKKLKVTAWAFLPLLLVLAAGCGQHDGGGGGINNWNPATLTNAVYGGTNPGGAWVTVTFRGDGKMIGAFSGDNTSSEWDYVCSEGAGSITTAGWTPGVFSVPQNGETLTFNNFGGHGGEKVFNRLRAPDLTAAESPANLGSLSADLAGSVWGGSTPAGSNTAWLTLTFRPKRSSGEDSMNGTNVAVISYSHDNSTAVWDYSYDNDAKVGTAFTNGHKPDDGTTTWNPGAYYISVDGKTLTFTSFMGGTRSVNRYFPLTE